MSFLDLRFLITPLVSSNFSLRKQNGQSRMDEPDTLKILGTQDTGRKQTKTTCSIFSYMVPHPHPH